MFKVNILKNSEVVQFCYFETEIEAENWIKDLKINGSWGDFESEKIDVTSQFKFERLNKEQKNKDHKDRVKFFKKIDWSKVDINIEVKTILEHLVNEIIKDEQ